MWKLPRFCHPILNGLSALWAAATEPAKVGFVEALSDFCATHDRCGAERFGVIVALSF